MKPAQHQGSRALHAAGNTRPTIPFVMMTLLILGFAYLPFPATVSAQEVNVSVGAIPGELRCPDQKRRSPGRQDDTYAPPDIEDIAALPIRAEAHTQNIFLGDTNRADPSKPFAIGLWGDSHAASAYFSDELIRALGLTRDKVLPTFIPPTMDRPGVRLPIHKYCQSSGWSYEYAYKSGQSNSVFAKGLVNLKSDTPHSYLWVDFRSQPQLPNLRSVEVLYAPPIHEERTLIGISADEGAERIVELNSAGDGVIQVHAERPISIIKLRLIVGTLVLQGFVPEYVEKPALYLDTLGIPGATMRGWKSLNSESLNRKENNLAYDLVILEYGTNEGNDQNLDRGKYVADLRASLKNLRQTYPESRCVLIGPTDRGVLVKRHSRRKHKQATAPSKNLLHYAQIHHTLDTIQAAVGKEYSCAFWSWQVAMGGPGGAYSWLRHTPALISRDLTHLSVAGYQLSARKFVADTGLTNYVHSQ